MRQPCQRLGCKRKATSSVAFLIPTHGGEPLKVVTGLELCDEHFKEVNPAHWMYKTEVKQIVWMMACAACVPGCSPLPLEFTRAYVQKVQLTGREYKKLKAVSVRSKDDKAKRPIR